VRVGGGAEILDEQVRVRSEDDADVTVPHEALDAVRVHSAAEQLGCEGVAQVVEADGNVQGDGPEPPSAWIGEWTAPPIGDLAARRTEARLRIAGAFPVGAHASRLPRLRRRGSAHRPGTTGLHHTDSVDRGAERGNVSPESRTDDHQVRSRSVP